MQDKWIPNYHTNQVLHRPLDADEEWRVCELLDGDGHGWDRGVVGVKFHREDAEAILRIPLSRRNIPDSIVWLPNKDGEYTVKLGYFTARELESELDGRVESSGLRNRGLVWSKLWKLHLPSKIKVFGWRACQDILPTKENLARRRVIEDGMCDFCQQETESVLHVLWGCGVARGVWADSHRRLQKCGGGQGDFVQLVEELMAKVAREELEIFLVQCWVLWNQRNSVLHGGVLQDPAQLVKRAMDMVEEFRGAQERLAVNNSTRWVQKWEPPVGLMYKVNFDAAVFADLDASGVGVVVRNDKGEVMASLAARGPPVRDSDEAETLACRRALEFAVEAGFLELILEGDSLTVMKSLISLKPNRSRLGHIVEEIQCISAGLHRFAVSFVKRSANTVAHALAKYARLIDEELVWLEECPQPALEPLYLDSLGLRQ